MKEIIPCRRCKKQANLEHKTTYDDGRFDYVCDECNLFFIDFFSNPFKHMAPLFQRFAEISGSCIVKNENDPNDVTIFSKNNYHD